MLDRSEIGWVPHHPGDPFTALVYSINGLHVTDTMVDGTWLLKDRRLTTLDYASAVEQVNTDVVRLLELRKTNQGKFI
jgi:hypothetical protein